MPRINIDLPPELHRRLKVIAAERGVSLKAVVTDFLERGAHSSRSRRR